MPVQQIPILPGLSGAFAIWKYNVDAFANLAGIVDQNPGDVARVKNAQGIKWLPGTLGGTYYPSGFYEWDGAEWVMDDTLEMVAEELDNILGDLPVVASQVETDTGVIDDKYISPLKLKNRKGVEAFFLSAQGSFGTGGGWSDSGFIALFPVLLFAPNLTERAIYMFYALARTKFDSVNPQVAFIVYSTGVPVAATGDDVRWQLSARYRAEGEINGGGASETILQTQTLTTLTGNTRQSALVFTLDRTLISDQDVIHLELERVGGDAADTYASDAGVGQAGLIIQTVDKNP